MNALDRVCFLLERVLSRVTHESTRMPLAGRITIAQLRVLGFLNQHKGASLRDVAGALGISNSSATELVAKGVVHGYIGRVRRQSDRRVARLTLLSKGARVLAAAARARRAMIRRLLRRVDPKALDLARVTLETLDQLLAQGQPEMSLRESRSPRACSSPRRTLT